MKSMTGFGDAHITKDGIDVYISIKSLNSRFFEYTFYIPDSIASLEMEALDLIKKNIKRGKLYIQIKLNLNFLSKEIKLNYPLIDKYVELIKDISNRYGLKDNISPFGLLKFSEVIKDTPIEPDNRVKKIVFETLSLALKSLNQLKEIEGEKIKKILQNILITLNKKLTDINSQIPELLDKYKKRLTENIKDLIGDQEMDYLRLNQEIAIMADKIDIKEETDRLEFHIKEMKKILNKKEQNGKELEFYSQELLREVNTIGAKCLSNDISAKSIEMKNLIEQFKEQVRNIE